MESSPLVDPPKRRRRATGDLSNKEGDIKKPVKTTKKKVQPTVAVVTTEGGIQGSFEALKAPLIAHLDIHSADVIFYDQPFHYNPDTSQLLMEPEPYDAHVENIFECSSEVVLNTIEADSVTTPAPFLPELPNNTTRKEYVPQEILLQYTNNEASRVPRIVPDKTDIYCFWCCHPFDTHPCVIPQTCEDGVWKGYGNFCCPSCCLSYLLKQNMDTHIRWERIDLLNRLYNSGTKRIYPAPDQEILSIFGGVYDITEYRNIIDKRTIRVDIHWPPIVSILASMDTKPIDFYETSIKNTFIGGGIPIKEDGLKLKRSKPLKDRESTLDSCLNLTWTTNKN